VKYLEIYLYSPFVEAAGELANAQASRWILSQSGRSLA
jgi:hypothetical protein